MEFTAEMKDLLPHSYRKWYSYARAFQALIDVTSALLGEAIGYMRVSDVLEYKAMIHELKADGTPEAAEKYREEKRRIRVIIEEVHIVIKIKPALFSNASLYPASTPTSVTSGPMPSWILRDGYAIGSWTNDK
jgi:hypothetical protein